jgi:hypothetical protein
MTPDNRANENGDTALLARPGAKGVLCGKCDYINPAGSSKCEECESHLYIKCRECGAHTERFHSRCPECRRSLHKSFFEKMNSQIFNSRARVTPLQLALLLIFAAVAFYCVMMIERVKVPNLLN